MLKYLRNIALPLVISLVILSCLLSNIGVAHGAEVIEEGNRVKVARIKSEKVGTQCEKLEYVGYVTKAGIIKDRTATLFIGDSRTVGMNEACSIDEEDNTFVMAKVGEGYNYLSNNLTSKLKKIQDNGYSSIDIITNFGVNDLYSIDNYISYYDKIISDVEESGMQLKLTIVSVNPVENCETVSNKDIEEFNSKMSSYTESKDNVEFIDTYTKLSDISNITVDGLHYTSEYYKVIYNSITSKINQHIT